MSIGFAQLLRAEIAFIFMSYGLPAPNGTPGPLQRVEPARRPVGADRPYHTEIVLSAHRRSERSPGHHGVAPLGVRVDSSTFGGENLSLDQGDGGRTFFPHHSVLGRTRSRSRILPIWRVTAQPRHVSI